ncbi:MAG: hypothetical protein C0399_08190 [Syntrophus sp. (in: bacteria)]|nr:hypothetical protein [Syntrophus sp. (in: bacteria)]
MESFWNSPDKVDLVRFVAQWLAVVSTIIALIFAMRFSTLKNHADLAKTTADSEQRTLLENKIQKSNSELSLTQKELESTKTKLNNRITEAEEAAKPRPLLERLRTVLISIDPKIIPALKQGNTKFSGGITATQFNDLQKIAKEADAKKYITVSPDVRMGIGMGPEGVTYGVDFTLNPQLIKD